MRLSLKVYNENFENVLSLTEKDDWLCFFLFAFFFEINTQPSAQCWGRETVRIYTKKLFCPIISFCINKDQLCRLAVYTDLGGK